MSRITFSDNGQLAWFDEDKAEEYEAATSWDGQNHVDVNTGDRFKHQALYRTAGGRWVLHTWSQWQGSQPVFEFVDEDLARDWLIKNDQDKAVQDHFGPPEDERGPGRPEVGGLVTARLGDDLLAEVDAMASAAGKTRAATLRELVDAGLKAAGIVP